MQPSKLARLLSLVSIRGNGAILLGENIVVDGHLTRGLVRVVTHIHADHVAKLEESIKTFGFIAGTPLTLELIQAMGYKIPRDKILQLPYNITIDIDGDKLTLLPSNHIPGSAQVNVETSHGFRLGYTSDFKQPGTPVMSDLDVLVIDATYGREEWVRPWQNEVEHILVDIVKDGLMHGPVHIYAYHGKLQEVMVILRRHGIDAPFIAPYKVYKLTQVMIKHGLPVSGLILEKTNEALEAVRYGWYVYFAPISQWSLNRASEKGKMTRILLSGWELDDAYRKLNERDWIVSFSDHADFRQLFEYVEESKPRLLIVDSSRAGIVAEEFASKVRRKLGIPAIALPPVV